MDKDKSKVTDCKHWTNKFANGKITGWHCFHKGFLREGDILVCEGKDNCKGYKNVQKEK